MILDHTAFADIGVGVDDHADTDLRFSTDQSTGMDHRTGGDQHAFGYIGLGIDVSCGITGGIHGGAQSKPRGSEWHLSRTRRMTIGVGIDMVAIDEVRESLRSHGERYLNRIYTEAELRDWRTDARRPAARFAAKEATMKAPQLDP